MRTTPPKQVDYQEVVPHNIKTSVSDTSTNVTPVYWSASQLLSKLDHNSAASCNNPKISYYMQNGQSQSLSQQYPSVHPQLNLHNSMPVCNRGETQQPHGVVGLQSRELTPNSNSMPLWSYRVRDIPEEYTVTVSDMGMGDHMVLSEHPPPGVVPKPRNITQV